MNDNSIPLYITLNLKNTTLELCFFNLVQLISSIYFCAMKIQFSIDQIDNIARQLLDSYPTHRIFAFYAEMGSGKTTLISAICRQLGVEDACSSPTFSIINEYAIPNSETKVFHSDWYRLKDVEDAIETGVEEVLQHSNAYTFIEWPEIADALLENKSTVKIYLETIDETNRLLTIS